MKFCGTVHWSLVKKTFISHVYTCISFSSIVAWCGFCASMTNNNFLSCYGTYICNQQVHVYLDHLSTTQPLSHLIDKERKALIIPVESVHFHEKADKYKNTRVKLKGTMTVNTVSTEMRRRGCNKHLIRRLRRIYV